MSGLVNASVTKFNDGSVDVTPEYTPSQVTGDEGENIQSCPIALAANLATPRCYTMMFDGTRRACPYWIACVAQNNCTDRIDVGVIALKMTMNATSTARVGVLCNCARRNRPAGC
jgi:hypothetical protein